MGEKVNRILWNVKDGDIDEIVIHDTTVHVEQIDDQSWWIGVYLDDDRFWMGNFTVDSQGCMHFLEQDNVGIEWGDENVHIDSSGGPEVTGEFPQVSKWGVLRRLRRLWRSECQACGQQLEFASLAGGSACFNKECPR